MKKIMTSLLIPVLAVFMSCQEKDSNAEKLPLTDPTGLKIEQIDLTTVKLTWEDNAEGETGYRIFRRGENDPYSVNPIEKVDANATSYTFNGLNTGASYHFGIQAISDDVLLHSAIVYHPIYKVLDREGLAGVENNSRNAAPTELKAEQTSNTEAVITWKDNATAENGYNIYVREASAASFGEPVATIAADSQNYTATKLSTGGSYVFGVQATGATMLQDSKVETVEIAMKDLATVPEVTNVKTSYAYIAVSYKIQKISSSEADHGVCFSLTGTPDVNGIKVSGPAISAGKEVLQVVSSAYLETGKEYKMSIYIKNGNEYIYSTPQSVKLEAEPAAVSLSWVKQDYVGAEGVEIYKTTTQLNGRNLNAWYAIADPSKVDFRVMYPETVGSKKTIKAQAEEAGDCLALINGGMFGNYNIGVIMTEGKMTQQWHGEIEGCYWATDSQLYQITRPIIGVDQSGKAGAYWVGVPEQGTFYYYDRPQPNVVGQAKYPKVTSTSPVAASNWKPYFAISCGPMLVYDGKLTADNSKVDDTRYYTNYECWDESGIYSGTPDRSAVGVTEDGKIILFICDGRITASQGASISELGNIMKSLGCKYAMNLDGGGSTGMWVKGAGMINYMDGSWRAVKSTHGFFKK